MIFMKIISQFMNILVLIHHITQCSTIKKHGKYNRKIIKFIYKKMKYNGKYNNKKR